VLAPVYGPLPWARTPSCVRLDPHRRPADEMQVLTAYISDPGCATKPSGAADPQDRPRQMEGTDAVFNRELRPAARRDRRFTYPSRDEIAKAQSALQARSPASGVGSVGDRGTHVGGQRSTRSRGPGSLPAAAAASRPAAQRQWASPPRRQASLTHKGRADQSIGYVAWPPRPVANPSKRWDRSPGRDHAS